MHGAEKESSYNKTKSNFTRTQSIKGAYNSMNADSLVKWDTAPGTQGKGSAMQYTKVKLHPWAKRGLYWFLKKKLFITHSCKH